VWFCSGRNTGPQTFSQHGPMSPQRGSEAFYLGTLEATGKKGHQDDPYVLKPAKIGRSYLCRFRYCPCWHCIYHRPRGRYDVVVPL